MDCRTSLQNRAFYIPSLAPTYPMYLLFQWNRPPFSHSITLIARVQPPEMPSFGKGGHCPAAGAGGKVDYVRLRRIHSGRNAQWLAIARSTGRSVSLKVKDIACFEMLLNGMCSLISKEAATWRRRTIGAPRTERNNRSLIIWTHFCVSANCMQRNASTQSIKSGIWHRRHTGQGASVQESCFCLSSDTSREIRETSVVASIWRFIKIKKL